MEVQDGSTNVDKQDRLTLIAMTVGGLIFGAIFGAFVLPFLYGFAANFFDFNAKVPNLRWYCALAGAGIGGLRAMFGALKQIRRRRATRDVAANLGMEYSHDISDELRDELETLFGDQGSIRVSNAVHRHIDSARFVVADMRYRRSSGDSDSNVTQQTIAFFSSDQLQFPSLELQPEGLMINLLTNVFGLEDIDFENAPEFSDQYHLTGTDSKRIRQLFTAELLEHFTRNAGWQIKASGNRLLMFRPRKRFAPKQLESFINEAMETFSLFMAASFELQDKAAAAPDSDSKADEIETVSSQTQGMPGMLAALAQSMMVTPAELEQFLSAPVPRQIPAKILRQRMGAGSIVAAVMGCIFLAAGLILATAAGFGMQGPMNEEQVVKMILGTVFPLVGGTIAFFAIRYRRRNYRLLRHGVVAEGNIESVERTDVTVNNQRQYRLKIRFSDGLGKRTSSCNIYGKVSEDARRRHQEEQPVRLLYDRLAPQRILWADAFTLPKF